MDAFIDALLAYPTVFFSGALSLVLMYWVMVIVGIFDIDALDFDFDFAEGAGEALDGALDGAAEAALDGAAEAAVDGAAEAAMDGTAEALDGAAESADGAIEGADLASPGILASLIAALKLRSVPVTVSLSFITLVGWMSSFLLMNNLAPLLSGMLAGWIIAALVGSVSFVIATLVTSVIVRPLAPIFETDEGQRRRDFVGRECEVKTGRVDGRFGQAEMDDGGAGQLVQVRCDHDNPLKRGDRALVVSYDDDRDAYIIEPFDAHLAEALNHQADEQATQDASRRRGQGQEAKP